ncbi:MAG: hypothetical protein PHC62_03830, partial [Candidatus Izemoplasmatales bacterium]|nr:hypothetical protein [Candidatus Izemoplasmatales bacterium]
MEFETYDGDSVIVDEFHYSTEEQWTGEYWIDGSKIYTITFSVPKFSNAKINVNSGTKNIKVLTDVKGSFERDGYNFC